MNWQEVCENKSLHNLPFKIELNTIGKILMSPVKVYHSVLQGEFGRVGNAFLPTAFIGKW